MKSPINCPMCGHVTFNVEPKRYQYDSGEKFTAEVCPPCARLHEKIKGA